MAASRWLLSPRIGGPPAFRRRAHHQMPRFSAPCGGQYLLCPGRQGLVAAGGIPGGATQGPSPSAYLQRNHPLLCRGQACHAPGQEDQLLRPHSIVGRRLPGGTGTADDTTRTTVRSQSRRSGWGEGPSPSTVPMGSLLHPHQCATDTRYVGSTAMAAGPNLPAVLARLGSMPPGLPAPFVTLPPQAGCTHIALDETALEPPLGRRHGSYAGAAAALSAPGAGALTVGRWLWHAPWGSPHGGDVRRSPGGGVASLGGRRCGPLPPAPRGRSGHRPVGGPSLRGPSSASLRQQCPGGTRSPGTDLPGTTLAKAPLPSGRPSAELHLHLPLQQVRGHLTSQQSQR